MRRLFRKILVGFGRVLAFLFIAGLVGVLGWASWHFSGIPGLCGAALLSCIVAVVPAYRNVPTLKLGMVTFLGMRTDRVLREGANFVIPWFESLTFFDCAVKTLKVRKKFFCKDNLAVFLGGKLSWQIDPAFLATTFVVNQDVVEDELSSAVISELGSIAGAHNALDIKGSWEALGNLVNCTLRMATPPHMARGVVPGDRLALYADADGMLRKTLESERRSTAERSEVESRCGVQVIRFVVDEVDYTPETGAIMEEEGQANLRSKAKKILAKTTKGIAEEHRKAGLKPAEAEQAAEVTMDLARREIRNVEVGGLEKFRPLEPPVSFNDWRVACGRG